MGIRESRVPGLSDVRTIGRSNNLDGCVSRQSWCLRLNLEFRHRGVFGAGHLGDHYIEGLCVKRGNYTIILNWRW